MLYFFSVGIFGWGGGSAVLYRLLRIFCYVFSLGSFRCGMMCSFVFQAGGEDMNKIKRGQQKAYQYQGKPKSRYGGIPYFLVGNCMCHK